jgi:Chain length determinant protein.
LEGEMNETLPVKDNDEIDLAQLFSSLWKLRLVIVLCTLIGVLMSGGLYLKMWVNSPSVVSVSSEIRFRFNGSNKGVYPNGQRFEINDMIASPILDRVYEGLDLEQYGLTRSAFGSSITITPSSTNKKFIDLKYTKLLEGAKYIKAGEIQDINERYTQELQAARRKSAELTFVVSERFGIPISVLKTILSSIPEVWAKVSIDSYGVLDLASTTPVSFDQTLVNDSEYMLSTEYLANYLGLINGSLHRLKNDEVGNLQVDPETGYTASTLLEHLGNTKRFQLDVLQRAFSVQPIAKDIDNAIFYIENEILERQERRDESARRAERIIQTYNTYNSSSNSDSQNPASSTTSNQSNMTAQYGDEFITRLMQIGDELSDAKFKQALLNRSLELQLNQERETTTINRLERNLAKLKEHSNGLQLDPLALKRVQSSIKQVSDTLIEAREITVRLANLRKQHLLGNSSALYAGNAAPMVKSNFREQVKGMIKYSGIGGLAGLFIGFSLP